MSTIDPTGSDPVVETPAAGPARMDVPTTQQMVREMTTLTNALFSLLQPHRAPVPETATPEDAPSPPAVPLPAVPVAGAPLAPQPPAPMASIPLPSLPVPDLPSPEPEPETADEEDQPEQDSRQSMALMNEIAFLDE